MIRIYIYINHDQFMAICRKSSPIFLRRKVLKAVDEMFSQVDNLLGPSLCPGVSDRAVDDDDDDDDDDGGMLW